MPSRADVEDFRLNFPDSNIVLRLPPGVLGIDVDHYGEKRGADTIREMMGRLGPLPDTFSSTSRGRRSPSRIFFYRVPEGMRFATGFRDVELIHFGHRFAVVWPSTHPDTNARYDWYDPRQRICPIPSFDGLPELPA